MKSFDKVMVPFDFSEAAIHALDYTLNLLGDQTGVDLLVLHVANNPVSNEREAVLQEEFNRLLLGLNRRLRLKPRFLITSGNLLDAILRSSIDQQINLLVMGTMGDREGDEAITNTSRLVQEINSPVLVIPYGSTVKKPKEIALLIGNEKINQPSLLGVLLDFANSFDSRVHVLTIYRQSILAEYGADNPTEDMLEYYLEHFFAEHTFKKEEDIESGIMDYISEKKIDLVSIIPRNHLIGEIPSEGKLTKVLTLHTEVPLLILD